MTLPDAFWVVQRGEVFRNSYQPDRSEIQLVDATLDGRYSGFGLPRPMDAVSGSAAARSLPWCIVVPSRHSGMEVSHAA